MNVKQSAAQKSTEKSDHTFSVQTLIEWFNREIPDSMACLDAEVEEDVLERGMAHAPPEPWHRVDEGLLRRLGPSWDEFLWFHLMNAWGTLRSGARAVLAKKKMSEARLQREYQHFAKSLVFEKTDGNVNTV